MTSPSISMKPSAASLTAAGTISSSVPVANVGDGSNGKPFKPCANCTCAPGLLWRQGRRKSKFLRQMSNTRRASSQGLARGGSNESIYSSDSISQTRAVDTTDKLLRIRRLMVKHDLCCYIIPSEDEHQSEYVSSHDQRRAFISGFTGSAGIACVTRNVLNFNTDVPEGKAILSTDGRYFNQASQQLDKNWCLLRRGVDKTTWVQWCVKEAVDMSISLGGKPVKIGVDPKMITYETFKQFRDQILEVTAEGASDVSFVDVNENLVDIVMQELDASIPRQLNEVILIENDAGESLESKHSRVIQYTKEKHPGVLGLCVSALDEICWFLNLRGSDIPYIPVFFAYLIISQDNVVLFTDNPINDDIRNYLKDNNVELRPYDDFWNHLPTISNSSKENAQKYLLSSSTSWAIIRALAAGSYKFGSSPIENLKAVKNKVELDRLRSAQLKDGKYLAEYFSWLEDDVVKKEKLIDEYKAAEKLLAIKQADATFVGNSFGTISSTGANAAIIHYEAPKEGSSVICPYKIYLCDSGSQYNGGTTDITRTIHFTSPSKEEIENYTLVLKGCLALERLVFPEGTTGGQMDVLARQFLWQQGLNYAHGTGHGIGSYLSPHEGPHGIATAGPYASVPFVEGFVTSNEPGFYKDGEYGIRIENDLLVVRATDLPSGSTKFLKFENLTLVPYCRNLIDINLLTKEERKQVNDYHRYVFEVISPELEGKPLAHKWLKRETAPI